MRQRQTTTKHSVKSMTPQQREYGSEERPSSSSVKDDHESWQTRKLIPWLMQRERDMRLVSRHTLTRTVREGHLSSKSVDSRSPSKQEKKKQKTGILSSSFWWRLKTILRVDGLSFSLSGDFLQVIKRRYNVENALEDSIFITLSQDFSLLVGSLPSIIDYDEKGDIK